MPSRACRVRHFKHVAESPFEAERMAPVIRPVAALTRRCAPPSPIRWARDIAQVKRPDCVS